MISRVTTHTLSSLDGQLVTVETDVRNGLPGITIVGMGNKAVTEARERIRSAITHSQLTIPPKKYTINLAPADVPKNGSQFDLPLALSLLVATGQLRQSNVDKALFAAELSLNGSLKAIRGAVAISRAAQQVGIPSVYLPPDSAALGALVEGVTVYAPRSLHELFLHLKGEITLDPVNRPSSEPRASSVKNWNSIVGHEQAKRALVIAAAGRHNILLYGPPGTGKTLLASTLSSLLPPLSDDELVEVTHLHNLRSPQSGVIEHPPFRAPHHSIGLAALIGGGARATPGEMSLAHHGVLLLDELPEFSRDAITALRQPLQSGVISISRLHGTLDLPARCICIATMNPCPCGFYGDSERQCVCSAAERARYRRKLSGPLLDRFALCLPVYRTNNVVKNNDKTLNNTQYSYLLESIRSVALQQNQRRRSSTEHNAYAYSEHQILATLPADPRQLLEAATTRLHLSIRAILSIAAVAQTIADLAGSPVIQAAHVAEALQLRGGLPADP